MFSDITITGLTRIDDFPKSKFTEYYKECMDSNVLYIPEQKPNLESIDEININICIDNNDIINTILGPKLIVNGRKNFKIMYTANNSQQTVHSSYWSVPFCEFILLKGLDYKFCNSIINYVFVGIENICVKSFDKRFIDLSTLFIICPQFKNSNPNSYTNCDNFINGGSNYTSRYLSDTHYHTNSQYSSNNYKK